jgi:surfeit locus 1 family protein
VVAVNRGWIRNDGRYSAVPADYRAVPAGEVEVHGLLLPSQERGTFGPTDPGEGYRASLARLDLDRLDLQVEGDLEPVWVQLTRPEAGAPDPSPRPLEPPVVNDEGPHLSYAVQWFIFASIAGGGYPLILRRRARERSR